MRRRDLNKMSEKHSLPLANDSTEGRSPRSCNRVTPAGLNVRKNRVDSEQFAHEPFAHFLLLAPCRHPLLRRPRNTVAGSTPLRRPTSIVQSALGHAEKTAGIISQRQPTPATDQNDVAYATSFWSRGGRASHSRAISPKNGACERMRTKLRGLMPESRHVEFGIKRRSEPNQSCPFRSQHRTEECTFTAQRIRHA